MPLTGYHIVGFDEPPLSFREVDYHLLKDPAHPPKVAEFFSRTPHPINLIFYNGADLMKALPLGHLSRMSYGERGGVSATNKTRLVDAFQEDATNLLARNNYTGLPVIPLTPWMIAHRMAHLPMVYACVEKIVEIVCDTGIDLLRTYYGHEIDTAEARDQSGKLRYHLLYWGSLSAWEHERVKTRKAMDVQAFHSILASLVTSRAGQRGQISLGEYTAEWFAQYIRFGRPLMAGLPERLDLKRCVLRDSDLVEVTGVLKLKHRNGEREILERFSAGLAEVFSAYMTDTIGLVIVP